MDFCLVQLAQGLPQRVARRVDKFGWDPSMSLNASSMQLRLLLAFSSQTLIIALEDAGVGFCCIGTDCLSRRANSPNIEAAKALISQSTHLLV